MKRQRTTKSNVNENETKTENAADSGLPVPHGCGHGKRPVGGVRPRQPRPEHHQLRQGDGGDGGHEGEHPERLSGNAKDFPAGKEVLRRAEIRA